MSAASSPKKKKKKPVSAVILDLDGTLLNTDALVGGVMELLLVKKYGKQWDGREVHKTVGKTLVEAAAVAVREYGLPCSAEEFETEINAMFINQWCKIKALAGADRLIKHLADHRVPMALASNSPRANIDSKISCHQGWKESFSVIIGGDEVRAGKPSPEIYLEAANRLDIEPSSCLVIEDSVPGVTGGKAAGMQVLVVPSIPNQPELFTAADDSINSLLDLRPEQWGLPRFEDWIEGTLPIQPWHVAAGPVINSCGSKVLEIPKGSSDQLSEHPCGVYFGWAGLQTRGVCKMAMSIGWNPHLNNNTVKTIEPWLLRENEEDDDIDGEDLLFVVVGYIRPEADFPTLESLIAKIRDDDGRVAEKALDLPLYSKYKDDPFLNSSSLL